MYKDDHSMEESEESGEDEYARNYSNNIYSTENHKESDSKIRSETGAKLEENKVSEPVDVRCESTEVNDFDENHTDDWSENVAETAEEVVVVDSDAENKAFDEAHYEKIDDEVFIEISKKIQNFEFQVSYEKLSYDNENYNIIDQMEYGSVEIDFQAFRDEVSNEPIDKDDLTEGGISENQEENVDKKDNESLKKGDNEELEISESRSHLRQHVVNGEVKDADGLSENQNYDELEKESFNNQDLNQEENSQKEEISNNEDVDNSNNINDERTPFPEIDDYYSSNNKEDLLNEPSTIIQEESNYTSTKVAEENTQTDSDRSQYNKENSVEHADHSENIYDEEQNEQEHEEEHEEKADQSQHEHKGSIKEESDNTRNNIRHKSIPRHKKQQSQRHDFLAEEEDIFNISNDNLENNIQIETPVKEVSP